MTNKYSICFVRSFFVSLMRFFCGFKKAQINAFSANRNVRLPFLPFRMPRNAFKSRFVEFIIAAIHTILLMRNFAQICNSVIRSNTVYMINIQQRPSTIMHCPCHSMGWHYNFIYTYFNVPKTKSSSNLSLLSPLSCIFPNKISRKRVIKQFIVKNFYWNFSHSNGILYFLNGVKYGVA